MTDTENMPAFTVLNIDHPVFRVLDLDRSVAFYSEVPGDKVDRWRDALALIPSDGIAGSWRGR